MARHKTIHAHLLTRSDLLLKQVTHRATLISRETNRSFAGIQTSPVLKLLDMFHSFLFIFYFLQVQEKCDYDLFTPLALLFGAAVLCVSFAFQGHHFHLQCSGACYLLQHSSFHAKQIFLNQWDLGPNDLLHTREFPSGHCCLRILSHV